jgi:hypothetical protein
MSAQLSTHLVMKSVYYFKKSPVLLEYPDRFFLLIAAAPLCYSPGLNTLEFLGVPALSDSTWIRLSDGSG